MIKKIIIKESQYNRVVLLLKENVNIKNLLSSVTPNKTLNIINDLGDENKIKVDRVENGKIYGKDLSNVYILIDINNYDESTNELIFQKLNPNTNSFIDSVRVLGRPKAKINNLPTSLCDPATVAFSNGSNGDLPMSYFWQFSNGNTSKAYEPVQVFSPPGVYGATLSAFTQSICIDTSVVSVKNVTVHPSPYAGFTFSPQVTSIFDPEITINNLASWDVISWSYLFGDGSGSLFPYEKHIYQEYGNYIIKQIVTNAFGCSDTISQLVKILPEYRFWIPNAFTPDENLLNDYFMPIAIGVINYEFEIFNKWGEKLFSTKNPKQGWNGYFKGQECKQDVYVWRITFKNVVTEKDEVHYGHVSLLKNL
jgi:gliding motility-associated-like protein